MSKKRKKRPAQQQPGDQVFERARRELAKGNAKAALKDAKVCYRGSPTPDRRQLLEQSYLGRVEQLHRQKLSAEARAILAELLDLSPSCPEVTAQIPRLQVIVGHSGGDAAGVFGTSPELLVELVDQAVLDRRVSPPDYLAVPAQVKQVRGALQAVEQGDDEAAIAALTDIARQSPLCDWKLFVRGLAAFYQSDRQRMQENWRRLDTSRPAHRIAVTLQVAAGDLRPAEAPIDVSTTVHKLENRLQADPAASLLKRVVEHARDGDWTDFFRDYRTLRQRFAKTHAALLDSIVDIVWKRSVREGDERMLAKLTGVGPTPALDPRWNRARAMMAEHPHEKDATRVERHWTAYAEDVTQLDCLTEDQRRMAAGLSYLRLARQYVEYAAQCARPSLFFGRDEEQEESFRIDAVKFFRKSIDRCPRLTPAYRELAEVLEEDDEPDKAAGVLTRLVREQPDDFDAHVWLATHYLGCDDPARSERHVEAAFRLKPRDPSCETLRWNQRVTMIRGLTKKRMFQAARQEWEQAAQAPPPQIEPFTLDTLRAGIELKAKNQEAAREFLGAAIGTIEEPTAIWIQMSFTAARCNLPREVKKDFDERFKRAIQRKPTSATAGRLARFLSGLKQSQINYTGRATQERLVIDYLKRAGRVRWNEDNLRDVCHFLWTLPKQWELREELVETGRELFPNNPAFLFWTGVIEMEAGPMMVDVQAATFHMNRALELARESKSASDQWIVPDAQHALSVLRDLSDRMPFPMGSDDDDEDFDSFEDDDYEDDDEEDEDDAAFGGFTPPPPDMTAEEVFRHMQRTLPPPIVEMMKRMAAKSGADPVETIRKIMAGEAPD